MSGGKRDQVGETAGVQQIARLNIVLDGFLESGQFRFIRVSSTAVIGFLFLPIILFPLPEHGKALCSGRVYGAA